MKNLMLRMFGGDQPSYIRRRDIKRVNHRPDVVAHKDGKTIVTESKPRLKVMVPGRGFVDAETYIPQFTPFQ